MLCYNFCERLYFRHFWTQGRLYVLLRYMAAHELSSRAALPPAYAWPQSSHDISHYARLSPIDSNDTRPPLIAAIILNNLPNSALNHLCTLENLPRHRRLGHQLALLNRIIQQRLM